MASFMLFVLFSSAKAEGSNPLSDAESLDLNRLIVDYHNWQRHFSAMGIVPGPGNGNGGVHPMASNMMNLVWDDGLADVAYAHSQTCKYHHNPDRNDQTYDARDSITQFVLDLQTNGIGENIGFGTVNGADSSTQKVVMDGLRDMFRESEFYNWEADSCSEEHCGHYTQMAWGTTRVIGCGYSHCDLLQQCDDSGTSCPTADDVDNAVYYVCNYWPLGNRYTAEDGIVPIYDEGTPCDNCPWDHAQCTYDTSKTETYDYDWNNVPSDVEDWGHGLCMGCGNPYYEVCATGLNNGLGDNCEDNIESAGCGYDWGADADGFVNGQQMCDPENDALHGLDDPETCTVADGCRYFCASCFCQENNATYKACDEECDAGLGRTVSGGCLGASYFESYIEELGGCSALDQGTRDSLSIIVLVITLLAFFANV